MAGNQKARITESDREEVRKRLQRLCGYATKAVSLPKGAGDNPVTLTRRLTNPEYMAALDMAHHFHPDTLSLSFNNLMSTIVPETRNYPEFALPPQPSKRVELRVMYHQLIDPTTQTYPEGSISGQYYRVPPVSCNEQWFVDFTGEAELVKQRIRQGRKFFGDILNGSAWDAKKGTTTVGQLLRICPDIGPFLPPRYQQAFAEQTVKSPLPKGFSFTPDYLQQRNAAMSILVLGAMCEDFGSHWLQLV